MGKSINCFFVALMMVALLVTGCTESEEPSLTSTPIPEMTLTLTPMVTPSPSLTPTPTPVITASPTPTTEVSVERSRLKLSVGQKRSYTLVKAGETFGNSWYEVMSEDANEGNTIYTIASGLEMTSSCAASPPTTSSATLRIDQYANPISYTSDATIGSGWSSYEQSVDCQIANGVANVIVDTTHNKGKTTEKTDRKEPKINLATNTVLLVSNVAGLSDLMYHTLPLKAGESFNVLAFLPENPDTMMVTVTIDVRPEQEVIDVGGKSYKVFVCDVLALNFETDYVTEDGTLVKVEISSDDTTPPQKVTIELVD